jgi:hypothetical protein
MLSENKIENYIYHTEPQPDPNTTTVIRNTIDIKEKGGYGPVANRFL